MATGGRAFVGPVHQCPDEPASFVFPVGGNQFDLVGGQVHAADAYFFVEERCGGDDPVAVDDHGAGGPAGCPDL